MKDVLISLGVEVLSTTPEMVTNEIADYLIITICLLLGVGGIGNLLWLRRSNPFSPLAGIAMSLCTLLIMICALSVLTNALIGSPQKETGNTIVEIRVNDQTNMQGIFEQFEVVDTSKYPVITVKLK